VAQQARLADRADDRVLVVRRDDRQLRDAVLVQQRDRVAHLAMRGDADQRRDRLVVVLAAQDVADGQVGRPLEEPVLGHPGVVEDLRQVGAATVGRITTTRASGSSMRRAASSAA
jgi:hypothetical protein